MKVNNGDFIVWALNKQGNAVLQLSDHKDFEECVTLANEAIKCGEYDKALVLSVKPAYFISAEQMKESVASCNQMDIKAYIKKYLNGIFRKPDAK